MDLDTKTIKYLLDLDYLDIERVEMGTKSIQIYCKMSLVKPLNCPKCGCSISKSRIKYRRVIRDLDISHRQVFLHLQVHQYECHCGRTFTEKFEFVSKGKSYTKRQAKYVFEMSAKQSYSQVGCIVDMCPKTVERLCYDIVSSHLSTIDWTRIYRIGIDEFAFKKGHKDYIVILINLDTGEIIDILEKREKAFLYAYFQALGSKTLCQIKEFCSDMWGPFQDLGKDLFPNALLHVDRFHWTMHLNKALDSYRKYLRRQNKEEDCFKGLKWKLIKRAEHLQNTELEELTKALNLDKTLHQFYCLRNEFQAIFDAKISIHKATEKVNNWLERAVRFDNKYLTKFIKLFDRHQSNIMNYFKTRLSSAAVEGKNNLLRTVKRFTFNMSNFQNFRYRVFAYNF